MNDCFQQIDFDPESIGFKSFPTMSKHFVDAMLPGQHGEGIKSPCMKVAYLTYICIFDIN